MGCTASTQRVLESPPPESVAHSSKLGGSSCKSESTESPAAAAPPPRARSRAGPPPPRFPMPTGRTRPSLDLYHPLPAREDTRLSRDSFKTQDPVFEEDGTSASSGSSDCGAAEPPLCVTAPEDVAALLRDVDVGTRSLQCGRSPVYNGTWMGRHVDILVNEHLVSAEADVERLEVLVRAATASPALQHPQMVQVLATVVQRVSAEGAEAGAGGCRALDEAESETWPRRLVDIWTVLEHPKLGTLEGAIRNHLLRQWPAPEAPPSMRAILMTGHEIASAVAHLHSHGVVQGQLDATAVHVDGPARGDPRCFTAKLSPACHFCFDRDPFAADSLPWESMPYVAPEVLMESEEASPAANSWSLGVMLWEMAAGRMAYKVLCFSQMMRAMLQRKPILPALPDALPLPFRALVAECLSPEPAARPGFPEILRRLEAMQASL